MALEAVVFPQELFRHPMAGGPWFYKMAGVEEDAGYGEGGAVDVINGDQYQMGDDGSFTSSGAEKSPEQGPGELGGRRGSWEYPSSCSSLSTHGSEEPWDVTNCSNIDGGGGVASFHAAAGGGRRKRQRARRSRNREEVENQRMTHIAVERNRRRQMNEYLAELRSLMPPSYVQKGDQASIVGGAINFVKELEQLLQSLEAQKRTRQQQQQSSGGGAAADGGSALSSLFGGFFTLPQYYSSSPSSKSTATTTSSTSPPHCHPAAVIISDGAASPATGKVDAAAAASSPDVEVTMVESHASLKVLSRRRRRPGQLLGVVAGLQGLRLTTLHLNVTTVGDVLALYSFSLKVEDDCQLSSANEIAAAVHQMLAGADVVPGNAPSPASTQQQPSSSPAAMGAVVERRRD